MTALSRRTFMIGTVAALSVAVLPFPASASPIYQSRWSGVAIDGMDTVAYFNKRGPVAGKKEFSTKWNGATWLFASAENLATFKANPEKWAPQYGGHCAWAVSQGYTASTEPETWQIVDGKLYLNYSLGVKAQWSDDIPGNIAKGDANWPGLKAGLQ